MGYCLGLSLRDLQEMMALTLGEVLSLSACNRIVSSVTARVEAFKSEPLENPPPVVMVDGCRPETDARNPELCRFLQGFWGCEP
jgi:hypothetical protein